MHITNSFYYDCLMKPNAKSVTTALRKVEGLRYNTIANGHGPVLRCATGLCFWTALSHALRCSTAERVARGAGSAAFLATLGA